ncbi:hypothetical protein PX52LOC_03798 [Limnoglobus roseus]|uniref:Uncharacterized protein n=1 Tax=Limnoglobus roseus TaxID=2598579 RepID=A0A5C1AE20_9BACT|nr:hypothetical protein PX52LOC_03798 [Limnoglobus roseus]
MTASSVYPDTNSTLAPGWASARATATACPPRPGITTSVTNRWIGPACPTVARAATAASLASRTLYPHPTNTQRVKARTPSSSSTSRTVSVPWGGSRLPRRVFDSLATDSTRGRYTLNVVPTLTSVHTSKCPSLCFTMPWTVARPRPVPLPGPLVVKNGSKILACTSAVIPHPVSVTLSKTYAPACMFGWVAAYPASSSTFRVSIVSRPPPGMASRAFTAKLITTCST